MKTKIEYKFEIKGKEYTRTFGIGLEWIELYLNSNNDTQELMIENLDKKLTPFYEEYKVNKRIGIMKDTIEMLNSRCENMEHNKTIDVISGLVRCSCDDEYSISEFDREQLIGAYHIDKLEWFMNNCYFNWVEGFEELIKLEIDLERKDVSLIGTNGVIDIVDMEEFRDVLNDEFEMALEDLFNEFVYDQDLDLEFI